MGLPVDSAIRHRFAEREPLRLTWPVSAAEASHSWHVAILVLAILTQRHVTAATSALSPPNSRSAVASTANDASADNVQWFICR
jgi:hypothetical protein